MGEHSYCLVNKISGFLEQINRRCNDDLAPVSFPIPMEHIRRLASGTAQLEQPHYLEHLPLSNSRRECGNDS
jgi:hypothetical protein